MNIGRRFGCLIWCSKAKNLGQKFYSSWTPYVSSPLYITKHWKQRRRWLGLTLRVKYNRCIGDLHPRNLPMCIWMHMCCNTIRGAIAPYIGFSSKCSLESQVAGWRGSLPEAVIDVSNSMFPTWMHGLLWRGRNEGCYSLLIGLAATFLHLVVLRVGRKKWLRAWACSFKYQQVSLWAPCLIPVHRHYG